MSKDSSSTKYNPFQFGFSILITTLIFYVGQFLPVIVLVIFLGIMGLNEQEVTDFFSENHLMQFLALLLMAVTLVYLVYKYLKSKQIKPFKFLKLNKKPTWSQLGDITIIYGLYFLTLLIATVLVSSITTIDVNQTQELGIEDPQTTITKIIVFATLVFLPPISEEVLFRGFLYQKLKANSSLIIAAITTSVIFGAAHLEYGRLNWIALVDTLIFSFYLIYIFEKHQSLYSSIILHAIKNSVAFLVLFVV